MIGQLVFVRNVFRSGDQHGTYVAMNRLMDMLEARKRGSAPGRRTRFGTMVTKLAGQRGDPDAACQGLPQ